MISDNRPRKTLVVIPARGGSKSIPRKNLAPLLGIPLVAYTIDTALKLDFVDRVIVSTDDPEIEFESLRFGSEVIRRSSDISGDLSRDGELLLQILQECKSVSEQDMVLFLRPTHPVRKPETVKKAYRHLMNSKIEVDSLRSMKRNREVIFKSWGIGEDGLALPAYNPKLTSLHDPCNSPRQILPMTYYQDGYVDIFPFSTVSKFRNTSGNKVLPFLIDEFSEDIDNFEELERIENHLKRGNLPEWFAIPKPKS